MHITIGSEKQRRIWRVFGFADGGGSVSILKIGISK